MSGITVDVEDTEDGGANIFITLSHEQLIKFAGIGLAKVIEDAAKQFFQPMEEVSQSPEDTENN